jgi:hypothetical protein
MCFYFAGCSDGYLRIFDFNSMEITNRKKCHPSKILNVALNSSQTKLFTVGEDNQLKAWFLTSIFMQSSAPPNPIQFNCLPDTTYRPFGMLDSDLDMADTLTARHRSCALSSNHLLNGLRTIMVLDVSENFYFILIKIGVVLCKPSSSLSKLAMIAANENPDEFLKERSTNQNDLEQVQVFPCENPVSIDLSKHLDILCLTVGCLDGSIHLFRLATRKISTERTNF